MTARPHRRSTTFQERINLPLTSTMKKALEEAADESKLAVVEVIRRSITATLEEEKSAVQTPPSKADGALRQKLLEVAGGPI